MVRVVARLPAARQLRLMVRVVAAPRACAPPGSWLHLPARDLWLRLAAAGHGSCRLHLFCTSRLVARGSKLASDCALAAARLAAPRGAGFGTRGPGPESSAWGPGSGVVASVSGDSWSRLTVVAATAGVSDGELGDGRAAARGPACVGCQRLPSARTMRSAR
jgi:hypothetical protein